MVQVIHCLFNNHLRYAPFIKIAKKQYFIEILRNNVIIWHMERSGLMMLIGGAAIALGLGLMVFKGQNTDRRDYPPITQGNALEIKDQSAGRVVTVDSATLEQSGFAVVREANGNRLGKVLGISPILGTGENTLIFINAITTKGEEYFVGLYADTNANGDFDERGDDILDDANGQEIKKKFKAL